MQPIYTMVTNAPVRVFDMSAYPWQATGNPGLWLKPVRHDDVHGLFLGLVRFDAGVRSGLHQHQGLATSFVIEGGLTDYHGSIGLHQAGLNFKGATHDAMAYASTLLVSRLEAPVSYPPQSDISGVHAGSRYEAFVNPDPAVPPEVNVTVDTQPVLPTGYDGISRQMIFDYASLGGARRYVQLAVKPQAELSFETTALTEMWVRGGNLSINGQPAHANCFVVCEAGARVQIDSPFGALLLVWAQGPETACSVERSLFGF
jgi:hypothetical protein